MHTNHLVFYFLFFSIFRFRESTQSSMSTSKIPTVAFIVVSIVIKVRQMYFDLFESRWPLQLHWADKWIHSLKHVLGLLILCLTRIMSHLSIFRRVWFDKMQEIVEMLTFHVLLVIDGYIYTRVPCTDCLFIRHIIYIFSSSGIWYSCYSRVTQSWNLGVPWTLF